LRLSAPFTRMSLFGLLGAGSGSSTIRSPFVILSHSLARLERMRSNLLPPPRGGQDSAHVDATLPFPFWRVSLRRRRSLRSSERQVSRGDQWGEALTRVSPTAPTSLLPGPVFRPHGSCSPQARCVTRPRPRSLRRRPYPSSLTRQTSSRWLRGS
jgi:hypothetical protein